MNFVARRLCTLCSAGSAGVRRCARAYAEWDERTHRRIVASRGLRPFAHALALVALWAGLLTLALVIGALWSDAHLYAGVGVAVLAGAGMTAAMCRRWRSELREERLGDGRCVDCGYDLRASLGRCPECGAAKPDST